jgi:hypothetical protein
LEQRTLALIWLEQKMLAFIWLEQRTFWPDLIGVKDSWPCSNWLAIADLAAYVCRTGQQSPYNLLNYLIYCSAYSFELNVMSTINVVKDHNTEQDCYRDWLPSQTANIFLMSQYFLYTWGDVKKSSAGKWFIYWKIPPSFGGGGDQPLSIGREI